MKNIQIVDGAENCMYDIFASTDDEFMLIFPAPGQDVEFIDDFVDRAGDRDARRVLDNMWKRRVDKKVVQGIHGTLFYELIAKKRYYPTKRESEVVNTLARSANCPAKVQAARLDEDGRAASKDQSVFTAQLRGYQSGDLRGRWIVEIADDRLVAHRRATLEAIHIHGVLGFLDHPKGEVSLGYFHRSPMPGEWDAGRHKHFGMIAGGMIFDDAHSPQVSLTKAGKLHRFEIASGDRRFSWTYRPRWALEWVDSILWSDWNRVTRDLPMFLYEKVMQQRPAWIARTGQEPRLYSERYPC